VWPVEIDALLEKFQTGETFPAPTLLPTSITTAPIIVVTSVPKTPQLSTVVITPPLPPKELTAPSLIAPMANGTHNIYTRLTLDFRWNGGTPCGGAVSCTLYLDRFEGSNIRYGVYSRPVTGTGYDWPSANLEPGNYQWTIVLRQGADPQVNPQPRRIEILNINNNKNETPSPLPRPGG
jgi:hypothetical protein